MIDVKEHYAAKCKIIVIVTWHFMGINIVYRYIYVQFRKLFLNEK